MGQIAVIVNGRTYRLACGAGEEDRLRELSAFVTGQVQNLADQFGQVGDDRLLVMALLMVSDQLWEAKERIAALEVLLPANLRSAVNAQAKPAAEEPPPVAAEPYDELDGLAADLPAGPPPSDDPLPKMSGARMVRQKRTRAG